MGEAVERLRSLVGEQTVALAATRVEGHTRRDSRTGKSVNVRTHMRSVGSMSNVELMSEFGNFSVEGDDTLTRMRAKNRYRQVEQEIRKRKLVPKGLDAPPAKSHRVTRVEAITVESGDYVMLDDGRVHEVKSKTVDGSTVGLSVESLGTGKRRFLVRKRDSLINKVFFSVAAFLALAALAFAGGQAIGDALDGHEKTDNTIGAPREAGGGAKTAPNWPDPKDNPSLDEMKPKPAPTTVEGYEKMFHKIDTDLWGAADVSISETATTPSGEEVRVWLYGDTFSGENGFVHSTAITQDGGNLHVSNDGEQLLPNDGTLTQDGKTYKRIFWIETAEQMENGNLLVTAAPTAVGAENSWDFFRFHEGSRQAEVSVNDDGDLKFERWLDWVQRPDITGDGEDMQWVGKDHFTYQNFVHDIRLGNGEFLKTNAQNWQDPIENHVDANGLQYEDFRPMWSSSPTQDTGYTPNPYQTS